MVILNHDMSDSSFGAQTSETIRRRVLSLAAQCLGEQSFQLSRMVTCEYEDGVLILQGQVPSYYHKQVAQSTVKGLESIESIDNRLVVTTPTGSRQH